MNRSLFYWVAVAVLFAYVVARAALLSFTIDEAGTYTYVIGEGQDLIRANNHYLNTWMMQCSRYLFGDGEFALRLPNVLSFLLYAWGVERIIRRAKRNWIYAFGAVMLMFQPMIIEFFGLARGYGLGLAFFVSAIAITLDLYSKSLSSKEFRNRAIAASILTALGVVAYFAAVNVGLMLWAVILFAIWKERTEFGTKWMVVTASWVKVFGIAAVAFTIRELWVLREAGDLGFGNPTLQEWITHSFNYFFSKGALSAAAKILASLGALIFVFSGSTRWYKAKNVPAELALSVVLVGGSFVGWVIQHYGMDALFPRGRTSLIYGMLIGIFLFGMARLFDEASSQKGWAAKGSKWGAFILMGGFLLNQLNAINFTHVEEWKFSSPMKEMMLTAGRYAENMNEPAVLEAHYMFKANVNYYILSRNLNIAPVRKGSIPLKGDFAVPNLNDFRITLNSDELLNNYTVELNYEDDADVALLVRKELLGE